jgi:hypothetical protein
MTVRISLIGVCLLSVSALAGGDDARPKSVPSALESDPKGWLDLFNGKDLKGWKRMFLAPDDKLNAKNPWSVDAKNGVLVCDGVGIKEMLLHESQRDDGVFHVEWRFKKTKDTVGYNSGVYVRSGGDGKHWVQAQVAMLEKPPLVADLFGDIRVDGAVKRVHIPGTGHKHVRPVGDWNTMEVTCKGKNISVWLNGAVVTTWTDCPVARGHVGMQAEFYFIEFKNLKFKPLQ